MMMKSHSQFFKALALVFVVLGIAVYSYFTTNTEPQPLFSATIHRDCAPWDGSAFTVRIPLENGDMIDISIWQSPDIQFPKTFSFPDDSMQVGNAILIHPIGLPDMLSGNVRFEQVNREDIVRGKFALFNEQGEQFKGAFEAQWDDQIILCG
jgi:hypothetical protein